MSCGANAVTCFFDSSGAAVMSAGELSPLATCWPQRETVAVKMRPASSRHVRDCFTVRLLCTGSVDSSLGLVGLLFRKANRLRDGNAVRRELLTVRVVQQEL